MYENESLLTIGLVALIKRTSLYNENNDCTRFDTSLLNPKRCFTSFSYTSIGKSIMYKQLNTDCIATETEFPSDIKERNKDAESSPKSLVL